MTNPNNAVGTNGAFGGRTSVNAFNDVMGGLSRGVLSGWACAPDSGLTVSLGGNGTTRDVAIAEDNSGNKTSINNISNSPINVTIGAAPGTNSRIDSIVAYVDNPPSVSVEVTDNPGVCGLIVVPGSVASTPSPANDSAIRTAITADGASGTTAYYVVLAYVTMASGTTDITSNMIASGKSSRISSNQIDYGTMKRWMPNYSAGQSQITGVDNTWTAPGNGFVFVEFTGFSSTGAFATYIRVNGCAVAGEFAEYSNPSGTYVSSLSAFVPVKTGDTIAVTTGATNTRNAVAYYTPGIWV